MRLFLGLFALLLLFASAAAWQGRVTHDLRRRQDHLRGAPAEVARPVARRETLSAGWNTLIVGRPSGADPFFVPEPVRPPAPSATQSRPTPQSVDRTGAPEEASARRSQPAPIPRFEPDFQITVRGGDVLSKVCQGHYRSRPEGLSLHDVVAAVSRYNGLSSPDAIRVGDVIRLPDVNRFVEPD